jgi:hypothetical protein
MMPKLGLCFSRDGVSLKLKKTKRLCTVFVSTHRLSPLSIHLASRRTVPLMSVSMYVLS